MRVIGFLAEMIFKMAKNCPFYFVSEEKLTAAIKQKAHQKCRCGSDYK